MSYMRVISERPFPFGFSDVRLKYIWDAAFVYAVLFFFVPSTSI